MIELQFQFGILFNIVLKNNYFEDNNLRNFQIVPVKETQQFIKHLGFIFKQTDNGLVILADNQRTDRSIMLFEDYKGKNRKLVFLLYINDPIFRNYTDVPFNNTDKIFLFSNNNLKDTEKGSLHKGEFVSEKDLISFESKDGKQLKGNLLKDIKGTPFGAIELWFTDEIIDKILDSLIDNEIPRFTYEVRFDARSIIWKYIIVPNYTKKLKDLRISIQEGRTIKFNSPESIEFKDKEALLIQSEKPIKYKEFYDFSFQLKRGETANGGKTIIKKMQYAPLDRIKPVNKNDKNNYCSEIYVYI